MTYEELEIKLKRYESLLIEKTLIEIEILEEFRDSTHLDSVKSDLRLYNNLPPL